MLLSLLFENISLSLPACVLLFLKLDCCAAAAIIIIISVIGVDHGGDSERFL